MLQVARLSPKLLGDAADLTARFFTARLNSEGGFQDRQGVSDLYYTVFGLEGLRALQREIPAGCVTNYLAAAAENPLDFVHWACLARCWANLDAAPPPELRLLEKIEAHRTPDGGYSPAPGAAHGTAYGCFLALGAYQDAKVSLPEPEGLIRCLEGLRAADGGWANQPRAAVGLTPPTAAALTLYRQLGAPIPEGAAEWLLARHLPDGGFFATPASPLPDLLSTATALHALAGCRVSLEAIQEPCLDFIDSLWSNQGGFYGHWSDESQDCEYTYYGLLALGHLSLY